MTPTTQWTNMVNALSSTEEIPRHCLPPPHLLRFLEESRLVDSKELRQMLLEKPLLSQAAPEELAQVLVERGLLNGYQAERVLSGQTFGLVLGNYRVLDLLGSGGMGVVYKAEHMHLKRPVALKVLLTGEDGSSVFLQRFTSEMQALAALHHPNIVLAFDAGEASVPHERGKTLCYLVMEYVPGDDLEKYVQERGPLSIPLACDFIRQAASGLHHANERGLIHRDIKPSNLLVTSPSAGAGLPPGPHEPGQCQVKILDFGLARLYRRRCTEAYTALGTVDYMAPEQARDARSVDIRADIYALGGTLYWLLTAERPFPSDRPVFEEMMARQHETPRPPRQLRPDIPLELEAIVCQMMARDPRDRYPTPLAVVSALDDFLESCAVQADPSLSALSFSAKATSSMVQPGIRVAAKWNTSEESRPGHRILLFSTRPELRWRCRQHLEQQGFQCGEAARPEELSEAVTALSPELILVHTSPTDFSEQALCRRLRAQPPLPHLKILLVTDGAEDEFCGDAELCDDVLAVENLQGQLLRRVRTLLRLREAEDRSDRLAGHLLATNSQLEQLVQQRDTSVSQTQDVLIFTMAKMAELRGQESAAHLVRMQQYVRVLAETAMRLPAFSTAIDDAFVRMLERCVLLHDIGKVAIPDHILLKPGKLDVEERSIMESHTTLGADLLEAVARQHGACLAFLNMAVEVTRHHHEHYDGGGYPDGLAGDAIPLAARLTAIADVYDAMRSKLVYKPGLPHPSARRLMLSPDSGQFDPALLVAFRQCDELLKDIFERNPD